MAGATLLLSCTFGFAVAVNVVNVDATLVDPRCPPVPKGIVCVRAEFCSRPCSGDKICCPSPCGTSCTDVGLPPVCSTDNPAVQCLVAPCDVETCPGHPEATCTNNYCGGCNAVFRDFKGNVVPKFACVEESRWPECLLYIRCSQPKVSCETGCPAFPGAVCSLTCGCQHIFTDHVTGNVLTDQCSSAVKQDYDARCPAVKPGQIGICVVCQQKDCTNGQICCPNGCGSNCMDIPEPTLVKRSTQECTGGQVYTECGGCQLSCDQVGKLVPCLLNCRQGCMCEDGKYLEGGRCLTAEECKALK